MSLRVALAVNRTGHGTCVSLLVRGTARPCRETLLALLLLNRVVIRRHGLFYRTVNRYPFKCIKLYKLGFFVKNVPLFFRKKRL